MSNQEVRSNIEHIFECETCFESWSENLLDLVDRLSRLELFQIFDYVKRKLKK